jgi:hypothetical protein
LFAGSDDGSHIHHGTQNEKGTQMSMFFFGYRTPEFGNEYAQFWGARAIYNSRTYSIDLLFDRQSSDLPGYVGNAEPDLQKWVNKIALPWLRKEVKKTGLSGDESRELVFKDGRYELRANPKSSFGYLYIGAVKHKWHVVTDNEGPWLTEGDPMPGDEILFSGTKRECECTLSRCANY